jgi:hypothetical protein
MDREVRMGQKWTPAPEMAWLGFTRIQHTPGGKDNRGKRGFKGVAVKRIAASSWLTDN